MSDADAGAAAGGGADPEAADEGGRGPHAEGEEIGVIGSPSSSSLLLVDILAPAAESRLVGAYCVVGFRQGGSDAYALGQITEVKMRNAFAEEPSMKGLIKQRGSVPPVSAEQDSHAADLMVSAVFEVGGGDGGYGTVRQATMDTVPHTGTSVRRMVQPALDRLMAPYASGTVHIGRALGGNVLLPSWFRHFGPRSDGGAGDAMHIGIFGKTGSGKSVLAKMILLSYMRNPGMSLLVLDPQGEFSELAADERVMGHPGGGNGRTIEAYGLSRIALAGDWDVFKQLLIESGFFASLAIKAMPNQNAAADQIQGIMEGRHNDAINRSDGGSEAPGGLTRFIGDSSTGDAPFQDDAPSQVAGKISLEDAHTRDAFERVWKGLLLKDDAKKPRYVILETIYHGATERERVKAAMERIGRDEMYEQWRSVAALFTTAGRPGAIRLDDLIGGVRTGRVMVVNLSESDRPDSLFWSDRAQTVVIHHILDMLVDAARRSSEHGNGLNALVILDEAHRFAPRERPDDGEDEAIRLRAVLRDAVRTTRKYGLGWMFISQTLASVDREILQQMRMYFFGYGLASGRELDALRELVGGNKAAQNLYRQFQDPESSAGERRYPFMSVGPSSPLATSQIPQFFSSLEFPGEFMSENAAAGGRRRARSGDERGDGGGDGGDENAGGGGNSGGGGRDPPAQTLFG